MSLINDYLKKNRGPEADKSTAGGSVPPVLRRSAITSGDVDSGRKSPVSAKTVVLLVVMLVMGGTAYFMTMPPETPDYDSSVTEAQSEPAPLPPSATSEPAVLPHTGDHNTTITAKNSAFVSESVSVPRKALQTPSQRSSIKVPAPVDVTASAEKNSVTEIKASVTTAEAVSSPMPVEKMNLRDSVSEPGAMQISSRPLVDSSNAQGNIQNRTPKPSRQEDLNHLFQVGVLAFNEGDLSRAFYYFNRVLALDSKHQDSLLNMAVISIKQGAYVEAQRFLTAAEKVDSNDARIDINRGLIAIKLGDNDKAQKFFSTALTLDPGAKNALNNLIWLAQKSGDLEAAALYYRNLAAIDSDNVKVLLAYASFCEQGQDFNQAITLYREALEKQTLKGNRVLKHRIQNRIRVLEDLIK